MKILISSNAPWCGTGYGNQIRLLMGQLKKQHEIVFLTNFGLSGNNLKIDDVLYFPMDYDWGNNSIKYLVGKEQPDLILSLVDWYVFNYKEWNELGIPWFNWTPIDMKLDSNCRKVREFVDNCYGVVPMSQFGFDELRQFKQPMNFIHHAIDSSIFKILDKEQSRQYHNLPQDAFIIGLVMANKDSRENRKAFDLQIEAISRFMKQNSNLKVLLYFHTEHSKKYNGNNIFALLHQNGIKPEQVIFTSPLRLHNYPFNDEEMATLFNSFDVLMNASSGEGFGVPIIEAQACGVPVITHNFSAMPELNFYGYSVKSNDDYKMVLEEFGYRLMPSITDMVSGLQYILENSSAAKSSETSLYIRENFDISKKAEQWLDMIRAIGADTQAAKGSGL